MVLLQLGAHHPGSQAELGQQLFVGKLGRKENLDHRRAARLFLRERAGQPGDQRITPGRGDVIDLAVRPVELFDQFHLNQAILGQAGQGAVNLALVRRPEVPDGVVEHLLQVIACEGFIVQETENCVFEGHIGSVLYRINPIIARSIEPVKGD